MRRQKTYTVQLRPNGPLHKLTAGQFHARLSVGTIYRPDPQRKPKYARLSPGYRGWIEDGVFRVRRWLPWWIWRAMADINIRTNAQMIEQLAILAVWTGYETALERQREAALQYAD